MERRPSCVAIKRLKCERTRVEIIRYDDYVGTRRTPFLGYKVKKSFA